MEKIESKVVNNLRALAATMISRAGSGHTGISLGATAIFYSLYNDVMNYYPNHPDYYNRDRFVMDSGHASALLYASLYAYGFDYSKDDLMNYRKMGSKTKGHPAVNPAFGVDASGGPLGQGIPMAVGMAIAERILSARFNKPEIALVDHWTYCFAGDGGMMEGLTNEASSLAGTLGLNKLIVLYDSNNITIEGATDLAFTENVLMRYRALGWNTIEVNNGEDTNAISSAINLAKQSKDKPTIIKINTQIGFGTPHAGKNIIHGMALKEEELAETIKNLNVGANPYELSAEVRDYLSRVVEFHNKNFEKENMRVEAYKSRYPEEYAEFLRWMEDYYSKNVDWKSLSEQPSAEETRTSSGAIINELAKQIPNFFVGSADLAPSTKTEIKGGGDFSRSNPLGRNLHFGVREHAMGAICNGIMLHGGLRVACSTFMVFSDYLRHAVRMSALMNVPVIYIFSHDSIGVGEDGKTHQPVEFNAMYRAMPNLLFFRPCDRNEAKIAYKSALNSSSPTILALTRQKTENLRNLTSNDLGKGAYFVYDSGEDAVIYATGSEVSLALDVANELFTNGVRAKVVSVPCVEKFFVQSKAYQDKIMCNNIIIRVAIEASTDSIWFRFVGREGLVFGVNDFGKTATGQELYESFGLTRKNIVRQILKTRK